MLRSVATACPEESSLMEKELESVTAAGASERKPVINEFQVQSFISSRCP